MDDSYIIANFHALCRLCLVKSGLTVSIFDTITDNDEENRSLTSKIFDFSEVQVSIYKNLSQSCIEKY